MLMWHRRHPRQQPLDTAHDCTIKAAVQPRNTLSAESKGCGADIINSSSPASCCLEAPTHHQYAHEVSLPNLVEEPDAAAAVCPPSPGCPRLPPPMHQAPIYPQPDAVATANEQPNLVATRSSNSTRCASPPSLPHHLAASKPMSRPACPSPPPPHRLRSKPRFRPPPSVVSQAVAQDQSGQQPQAAKSATTGAANSTARANSSAAAQHHMNTRLPTTTSQLSAAASKASGAAAARRSTKANLTCRAGASGPLKTNSRAGAAAVSGPAKTRSNCRAGAVAATGPPQTRSRTKAASGGSANIMNSSKNTAAAPNRKPLPVGSRSALNTIQEGELLGQLDQSRATVLHFSCYCCCA